MATKKENEIKQSWGGKRPGAGRPSTGRKKRTLYITDEEYNKLKEYLQSLRSESVEVDTCDIT